MKYLNINTNRYPMSAVEVIAENPNTSFPIPFELPEGYVEVQESVRPVFDATTHKVVELTPMEIGPGVFEELWSLVELTEEEALAFAAAAAADLAQAKAMKNAQINTWRLLANRSTFTFQGKTFSCDELSRSDIEGTQGQVMNTGDMPTGWPGGWKAVDNTYVLLPTTMHWKEFYGAMYMAGLANFARAQTLKAQLEAATTLAEVSAITW